MRALRLMRKGVSYMCNRKMAGAMRRWSSSIGGQGRSATLMERSLAHLRNRQLALSCRRWSGTVAELAEAMRLLRRGAASFVAREVLRAFARCTTCDRMASRTRSRATASGCLWRFLVAPRSAR